MFGRRGEIQSHRSAASRQDHERDALFAAAERKELAAQKFEEWVRFKDSFDRGLALFTKLDPSHCEVSEPRTREICRAGRGRSARRKHTCAPELTSTTDPNNVMKDALTYQFYNNTHGCFLSMLLRMHAVYTRDIPSVYDVSVLIGA